MSLVTCEISTLSLHDALPIFALRAATLAAAGAAARAGRVPGPPNRRRANAPLARAAPRRWRAPPRRAGQDTDRSEEHTSELQSLTKLVCRLLLEKKKTTNPHN